MEPRIEARIVCNPEDSKTLVHHFTDLGVTSFSVKNAVIVLLPCIDANERTFAILKETVSAQLFISCFEWGSGNKSGTGKGTVVCGVNGEPLKPSHFGSQRKGFKPQAYFSVPESVITVKSYYGGKFVLIKQYTIVPGEQEFQLKLEKTVLYEGEPNELPEGLGKFEDAVHAAVTKSQCLGCRSVHYAIAC